ncbi:MAG: hypothetical protein IJ806_01630 [Ruminococcus sp.]|nr:hypothetical protein [Ruminococcus sp.]
MLFLRMHIFDIAAGGLIIALVSARVHRAGAENGNSNNKQTADLATLHRLGRLIGWLMAAIGIVFLIAVWERLPNGDVADIYHGLAYFADLDRYLDKRLLLVPHAALILLLALLEIASVRAYKKGNGPWVRFLASAKVFSGVYGFIAILFLESEMKFSFGLLGFFAALVLIELIKLIVENIKEKE